MTRVPAILLIPAARLAADNRVPASTISTHWLPGCATSLPQAPDKRWRSTCNGDHRMTRIRSHDAIERACEFIAPDQRLSQIRRVRDYTHVCQDLVMAKEVLLHGRSIGEREAVAADLAWLEMIGLDHEGVPGEVSEGESLPC